MSRSITVAAAAAVTLGLCAGAAHAQTVGRGHGREDAPAAAAGQKAAIDAQGKLRAPTPEEVQMLEALGKALSRPVEGLVPVTHANGMVGIQLPESFQEYFLVTTGEDGTLHRACVHDAGDARRFLLTPRPAAAVLEEK